MRKSQIVDLLSRRLGVRATRLTNLVQRLAEAGLLPIAKGPPYPSLSPVEIARMLVVAVTDEGLGASATVAKYGGLPGPGASLEEVLGHALSRPESLAPFSSGLEIHTDDTKPYAVLTTVTADGARTLVFGDMPDVESVDRTVLISGAVLFAVAKEIAGMSAADVDKLLAGAGEMQPRSKTA